MRKEGFTLVELLVSIAVSFIVIVAIVNFLIVGSQSYQRVNRGIDLQRNARLVSDRLIREIKRAKFIDATSDGSSLVFNYYVYEVNSSNVIFSTLTTVRYYIDNNGILRRQVKQGTLWVGNNPLTENNFRVLTPVFSYLDNFGNSVSPNLASIILVNLRLDANNDNQSDYTLTFSIHLPLKGNYFLR